MKVLIVGGVAGGMSAATRLRRLDETAEIIIFEKGPYVSFANCGLPYFISGEIENRDDLLVQTPQSLKARFALDVRPNSEVIEIDYKKKQVRVVGENEDYWESFDHLVLSPGAEAFTPQIEGIHEAENLYTLRNVPDLDKIMTAITTGDLKKATIIGAGFIGIEMAENLKSRGFEVTIVESSPQVLPTLDEEMAILIEEELIRQGITVIKGESATAFRNQGKLIKLENGTEIETDLIILSVGVTPATSLAKKAGIKLGLRGGILVDDSYQTNLEGVYAVGDAIVVTQQVTGEDALISLASPANRQGRQVADVIAGIPRKNRGSIGTAIVRVFDLTAASTGLTERQAKNSGLTYQVVHSSGNDHAGYYPGATSVKLKLIFNPKTGELYGAQGIGKKGIDKRIDVLATAIKGGLKVEDLPELELTYAPPFGVAKDPVNMLGYMALNIMDGLTDSVQWHELVGLLESGAKVLDVREPQELQAGRFKQSVHIPLNELRNRLDELDKEQSYIVSCASGLRSYIGERILKQHGFNVKNLDGAFGLYKSIRPEDISY